MGKVPFIGLSATPWTRGLGKHFDDLIVAAETRDLIDEGYFSDFIVYAPNEPDLAGVGTVAGDLNEGQLADAVNTAKLVADVIDNWLKLGEDRPTLCYGVDRAHALHLAQRFEEAAVASAYIDCFTPRDERERLFKRFTSGAIRVICNVNTLTTGIDLDVRCVIDARPTRSEMRFVQTIGRGLRTAAGKDRLLIFDHAGNHLRLGRVDQIHHARLDDGRKTIATNRKPDPERSLRVCDKCHAVLQRAQLRCDLCGAIKESKSDVVTVNGELVELGSGLRSKPLPPDVVEKAVFYGELKGLASEKGHNKGWIAHKFREKFGIWPNDPSIRSAEQRPPSLKLKQWILFRAIAFAKRRQRG